MTAPPLRCRNCWRPYAIHANDVCPPGGYTTYEPDDSPEARVYAAVEELIAVYRREQWDSEASVRALNEIALLVTHIEPAAASSGRKAGA